MSSLYLARQKPEERHELIHKLHSAQNGHCFICEDTIDLAVHKNSIDIDHVVPLKVGGEKDASSDAKNRPRRFLRSFVFAILSHHLRKQRPAMPERKSQLPQYAAPSKLPASSSSQPAGSDCARRNGCALRLDIRGRGRERHKVRVAST